MFFFKKKLRWSLLQMKMKMHINLLNQAKPEQTDSERDDEPSRGLSVFWKHKCLLSLVCDCNHDLYLSYFCMKLYFI